ncbi:MAG TPA: Gfo/Idh/MocA family oxidoreductase, partial [Polyangiaceae bacterium]|nr:Gfo/Idh/MocA family oxidoreductase [Polyangiaceae bacterium]
MTARKLRWGIISTGKIAHTFARSLAQSDSGELVGVASRTPEAARKFAAEFGVSRAHGSYEALLADPEVEVVY